MTGGYEIGAVYVWVSSDDGIAYLKSTECVITSSPREYNAGPHGMQYGWPTDAPMPPGSMPGTVFAFAGDLRRKRPPTGEEPILRMFDLTAPAPREVEAA